MPPAPPQTPEGPDPRRIGAFRLGLRAETRAAWWLRLKGYRILARRARFSRGEIDLIARRGSTIAIVEVKARASVAAAIEAVTPAARRRIVAAAGQWLARNPAFAGCGVRFDIIALAPRRLPVHIASAFTADP
ncbi:YraN family protein [Segnochrobactraceae bacterium EtOH-i3]